MIATSGVDGKPVIGIEATGALHRSWVKEIPGAKLLTLEQTGHELPRAVWDVVVPAIVEHTSSG